MFVYWLLFGYFAAGALLSGGDRQSRLNTLLFALGGVILTIAIGLRLEVGGDWGAYQRMFQLAGISDYDAMLRFGDPAYQLLNSTVQAQEWPFWMVNLSCAAIFTWGLTRFARLQASPWLAMCVAIPYLVIVVGMGYTRQAVAIGVIMLGLAALERGASVLRFAVYVLIASLFHKTAVVAMLLVALTGKRNQITNLLIVIASGVLLYDSLLQDSMQRLLRNYVQAKYESQGALIRIAMSFVPAVLFIVWRRSLQFSEQSSRLWRNFSFATFAALAALLLTPSSTAVDRIALYLLPLQLAVLSRLPRLIKSDVLGRIAVVAYAFAIQFTWLNYAANNSYWVPYKSYLTA